MQLLPPSGGMEIDVNNLKKLLKKISLKSDIINIVLGVAFIISLIAIFQNPTNRIAILTASSSGGVLNAMFGVKMMKDPKRKSTGMSYVLIGIIIVALGFYLIELVKK